MQGVTIICLTDESGVLTDKYTQYELLTPMIQRIVKSVEYISSEIYLLISDSIIINENIIKIKTIKISEFKKNVLGIFGDYSKDMPIFFIEANQPLIKEEVFKLLASNLERYDVNCSNMCSNEGVSSVTNIRILACKNRFIAKCFESINTTDKMLNKIVELSKENIFEQIFPVGMMQITVVDEESRKKIETLGTVLIVSDWMKKGVKFIDPSNVQIDETVILEPNVTIGGFVVLKGNTHIRSGANIGEFSYLDNSKIGYYANVKMSTIVDSYIEDNVEVGPYAFIRGKSIIKNSASIGAYSEINDTIFGEKSKCKHFSYIGHTYVGTKVNIGAGTITCTYDGKNKYRSKIGDNAFIGSGSLMIAPSVIGKNSRTGAGSVITKQVMDNKLVFGVPAKEKKAQSQITKRKILRKRILKGEYEF